MDQRLHLSKRQELRLPFSSAKKNDYHHFVRLDFQIIYNKIDETSFSIVEQIVQSIVFIKSLAELCDKMRRILV